MSMPLAEALEKVDLKPGSAYRCRVKGCSVEVRVLEAETLRLAKPLVESDILLDPWVDLPVPTGGQACRAQPGGQLPFDVPTIS